MKEIFLSNLRTALFGRIPTEEISEVMDIVTTQLGKYELKVKPTDHLVVCAELSVKTIPFLLLNLSIRGICGMVLHADSMSKEIYQVYVLVNEKNDPLHFSDVTIADKTIFKIQEKNEKEEGEGEAVHDLR